MKHTHALKWGLLPELASVFAAALLCGIALIAHAQAPTPAAPAGVPPAAPPTAIGANGKPIVQPVPSKVLADPDTKMYSVCTDGSEHEGAVESTPQYKRPPKSVIVTEEEAKSRGYRAGAHKVSCK